ncbi:MAG: BrnA antitoxin family protein [Rhizobium sp.]|nr:BrnA antitoxin family protein [Rhizobium sp.]
MNKRTIPATDEAWEDGKLGRDESFVAVADVSIEDAVDEAAGTQAISIRLPKAMINDIKVIAARNKGIGYQTLMKQILQRFIDCEKKQIWNEYVAKMMKEQSAELQQSDKPAAPRKAVASKVRKAA